MKIAWFITPVERRRLSATFLAKATLALPPGQAALLAEEPSDLTGDVFVDDDSEKGLHYPSDFVPSKPRGEVLLLGQAQAPRQQPVAALTVRARVGGWSKTLQVVGDRTLESRLLRGTRLSEPQPFTTMPLTYARAFGGPDYLRNPLGQGRKAGPAPNLWYPGQDLTRLGAELEPAAFAPIPTSWEPRRSQVGTYSANYAKERWPLLPADFDPAFFQAAPTDQRIEGYWRGDEELEFENLHPEHAVWRSRLPGQAVRIFMNEKQTDGKLLWREVPLRLDTLWFDLSAGKAELVWRGQAAVRSMKMREIEEVFAILEPLSEASQPASAYPAKMAAVLAVREQEWVDEPRVISPEEAAADAELAGMDAEVARIEGEFAAAEAQALQGQTEFKAELVAGGVAANLLESPVPPAESAAELRRALEAQLLELPADHPDKSLVHQLISDFQEAEKMEAEVAAAEAEIDAEFPPPPSRDSVTAVVAGGGSLAGLELTRLDLSGLDLAGKDLTGARLRQAKLKGTKLVGAKLREADLSEADLSGADLTGAILDDADLTDAVLAGAKLQKLSLAGTNLAGQKLAGADLSACTGQGADFSKADLSGAIFIGAKLPRAAFSYCKLAKTVFIGAELAGAQFDEVQAPEIQMEGADLTGLQASDGSDFSRGNFRGVRAAGSIWEQAMLDGADFSDAQLTGALLPAASLRQARLERANLTKAVLDEACLQNALLTHANLLRASFDRADLTEASLRGANLYEAGLWDTVMEKADLRGANLKGTSLA